MCTVTIQYERTSTFSSVPSHTSIINLWQISNAISYSLCSAQAWCPLMLFSVKTLTCFIGFLLFCAVARWYKMRVRDEDYSPQRVVEEVYDRYLTAAAAHSKSYGSLTNYT